MDTPAPVTDFKVIMRLGPESGLTAAAQHNRDVMLKVYNAISHGDQSELAAILDPDILFVEAPSLPYGVVARGIDATLAGVNGMFATWREIEVEVEEILTAGDLTCLYMNFKAVSRATGQTYEGVCAEMFRFKNRKIIEWRPVYWDTHAARLACGIS